MPQTAEYWLERAKEARASDEEMRDPECKEIMFEIAKSYERIADFERQGRVGQSLKRSVDGLTRPAAKCNVDN
jgi:hypothetical protein